MKLGFLWVELYLKMFSIHSREINLLTITSSRVPWIIKHSFVKGIFLGTLYERETCVVKFYIKVLSAAAQKISEEQF